MTEETRNVIDVSGLEKYGFSTRGTSWWATVGFMVVEGTTLAICAASYLYLTRRFHSWPPLRTPPPDLIIPTISVIALLASVLIARQVRAKAHAFDLTGTRNWLTIGSAATIVLLLLRALEYNSLNTRWENDAYGSIVWITISVHSTLLLVDFLESVFIGLIFWLGPVEKKHFGDADDDALYWYFMVASWIPLYFLLYIFPRLV